MFRSRTSVHCGLWAAHVECVSSYAFRTRCAPQLGTSHEACTPIRLAFPSVRASRQASTGVRRRRSVQTAALYNPYPFNEAEYFKARVSLVVKAVAENAEAAAHGTVLLSRTQEAEAESADEWPHALVMHVAGDTLAGISQLLQGISSVRPMALDLLWQILERGQQISESQRGGNKWRLVRVAICDMRNSVYHGRLFFGDPETQAIAWDCDCRPSDAIWLSIKAACPIYINKRVWKECATEFEVKGSSGGSLDDALRQSRAVRLGPSAALRADPEEGLTGTALMTTVRTSDPEQIKRLKREMQVAISEEDFKAAARLRDHPWMQLYMRSQESRSSNPEEAKRLEAELAAQIEAFNSADIEPRGEGVD